MLHDDDCPCPFCGVDADHDDGYDDTDSDADLEQPAAWFGCNNKKCGVQPKIRNTGKIAARKRWNARTSVKKKIWKKSHGLSRRGTQGSGITKKTTLT